MSATPRLRGRTPRLVLAAIAIAGIVAAGIWVGERTNPAELAWKAPFDGVVRDLVNADNALQRGALESRYGTVLSYDELAAQRQDLGVAVERMRRLVHGLWPNGAVAPEHDALVRAASDVERALRTFETENSAFRVSARYLPTAIDELEAAYGADPERAEFVDAYRRATEAAMEAFVDYADDRRRHFDDALEHARAVTDTLDEDAARDAGRVLAHLERARVRLSATEDALARLRGAELSTRAVELQQRAHQEFSVLEAQAATFQRVQMAGSVVLLAALLWAAAALRRLYRTLEDRVAVRTADLQAARADLQALYDINRSVLQAVDRGLVAIDAHGRVTGDASAAAVEWFGPLPAGTPLADAIEQVDADTAIWFRMGLDELRDGFLPFELALDQMPKRIQDGERSWSVRWLALGDGNLDSGLLGYVTEVTEQLAREREDRIRENAMRLAERLAVDRSGTMAFIEDGARLLASLHEQAESGEDASDLAFRRLHTLKGNVALYGLAELAAAVHDVESAVADGVPVTAANVDALQELWDASLAPIAPLLATATASSGPRAELLDLVGAVSRGTAPVKVVERLRALAFEADTQILDRLEERSQTVLRRLGHTHVRVETHGVGASFDPEHWSDLWSASVHLLRNAVDHGVDSPEARVAAGKPSEATLQLALEVDDRHVTLRVSDDGGGVNWDAVRARAVSRGLPHETRADLADAMFASGLSTREDATDVSGRGVGLSAVREAVAALGGRIEIESERGQGTTFRCIVPRGPHVALPPAPRAASSAA